MISSQHLDQLPDIDTLRRRFQALAMLDAMLSPEWEYRYYSFNTKWAKGEQLGSMRDGEGDDFIALFNPHGCFLKGFAHESAMSPYGNEPPRLWPGLIEAVPKEFADCLREPAFNMDEATFVFWRKTNDPAWQRGPIAFPAGVDDPDGSEELLSILDGKAETYREWAIWYYDVPFLTVEMVQHVYDHRPLTDELVAAITQNIEVEDEANPRLNVADFREEILEIGYPMK